VQSRNAEAVMLKVFEELLRRAARRQKPPLRAVEAQKQPELPGLHLE
jgi:hypothetical protein